jgi:hypothetical protein
MTSASGKGAQLADLGADSKELQSLFLQSLAEPEVNTTVAATRISELRGVRRSRRKMLGVSAAAFLLLAAVGSVLLLKDSTPESVLADKSEDSPLRSTTTTSSVIPTSVAVATSPTVPPLTVPVTAPTPAVRAVAGESSLIVPPTTVAAVQNQPMTAELIVSTNQIAAGSVIEAKMRWSDPDLAAGYSAPHQIESWGDPLVSVAVPPTPNQPCDSAGGPAQGETVSRFSYSTPGQYLLKMTLDTCGGQGSYAERVERTQIITVLPPRYVNPSLDDSQDIAGQAFAVSLSSIPGSAPFPALSSAKAEFIPTDTAALPLPVRVNSEVQQFTVSGTASVFVVPSDTAGSIRVRFVDASLCAETQPFSAISPGSTAPVLQLLAVPCT